VRPPRYRFAPRRAIPCAMLSNSFRSRSSTRDSAFASFRNSSRSLPRLPHNELSCELGSFGFATVLSSAKNRYSGTTAELPARSHTFRGFEWKGLCSHSLRDGCSSERARFVSEYHLGSDSWRCAAHVFWCRFPYAETTPVAHESCITNLARERSFFLASGTQEIREPIRSTR